MAKDKPPEPAEAGEQTSDGDIVFVSVRVSRAVRKRWFAAAYELDLTMVDLVTQSVDRYLAKQAKKRGKTKKTVHPENDEHREIFVIHRIK